MLLLCDEDEILQRAYIRPVLFQGMRLAPWLLGLLVLLVSVLLDEPLALWLSAHRPSSLTLLFVLVTALISTLVIFFLMTSLFLWEERKREWIPALWASFFTTALATVLLKVLTHRARPFHLADFLPLDGISYSFAWWNSSFPSWHAAAVFSALPLLNKEFPSLKGAWIFFAVVISVGRLFVGVHYLSDVIAGSLLGLIIGTSFVRLEETSHFFRRRIFRK